MPSGEPVRRYLEPGWFTRKVFNRAVAALTRAGVSVWGSRELRVQGRTSGEWRATPVNLLTSEGERYLVAPRGETQWVRNLRVASGGELRVGRHIEAFRAMELGDDEKVAVLRAYLRRWKAEVGVFFEGVSAKSPDGDLRRIAPNHPVFRLAQPSSRAVSTTRLARHIRAPRARVYRALLDPELVEQWMVPDQMTSRVHRFEAREGGTFRISLTYDTPTTAGKTNAQTDTFHGRFVRLVPDTEVVQIIEFESDDPEMQGEMTVTYTLTDADDGTLLVGLHEHLPAGVSPADNELGWNMSIDKLARLVEQDG